LVILVPIPLSLIGIISAHWAMGSFFTATSMIGFIAGAGIILRNSIILVDFIELKLREGMPLALAVEEADVVRFRPMVLMAGQVAATLLFRLAVPLLYCVLARRGRAAELQRDGSRSAPAGLATIIPLSRTGSTP
jgi:Cu/Ag efflux pump CusA